MNRSKDKLVKIETEVDVRTLVQLRNKSRKNGISLLEHNSNVIKSHFEMPKKSIRKGRP